MEVEAIRNEYENIKRGKGDALAFLKKVVIMLKNSKEEDEIEELGDVLIDVTRLIEENKCSCLGTCACTNC